MSYFVFGCVTGGDALAERADIVAAAEGEGVKQGLHVFANEKVPQAIVSEMLREQVGQQSACTFLITSRGDENTADSLISPFERSPNQISEALASLERWTDGLLRAVPGIAISLFVTEGYDTSFSAKKGEIPGWTQQIAQFAEEGYIPSLRIDLVGLPRI